MNKNIKEFLKLINEYQSPINEEIKPSVLKGVAKVLAIRK